MYTIVCGIANIAIILSNIIRMLMGTIQFSILHIIFILFAVIYTLCIVYKLKNYK